MLDSKISKYPFFVLLNHFRQLPTLFLGYWLICRARCFYTICCNHFHKKIKIAGFKKFRHWYQTQYLALLWNLSSAFDLLYRENVLKYILKILGIGRTRFFALLYHNFMLIQVKLRSVFNIWLNHPVHAYCFIHLNFSEKKTQSLSIHEHFILTSVCSILRFFSHSNVIYKKQNKPSLTSSAI